MAGKSGADHLEVVDGIHENKLIQIKKIKSSSLKNEILYHKN